MSALTLVSNLPAVVQFKSADGKMVLSVIGGAGTYRFVEERELWEPGSITWNGYHYWTETEQSGIYASCEDALVAARTAIDWLSD